MKKNDNNKERLTRTKTLKDSFNAFWKRVLKKVENEDYFSELSIEDWIELKIALSDINNIITLKATMAFVDTLADYGLLSPSNADVLKEKIDDVSANANGYDVKCNIDNKKFVAEVKCNIPIKNGHFGANQEKGIQDDIEGLISGKSKDKIPDLDTYLKFLVVLSDENGSQKAAMEKIIKKKKDVLEELPQDDKKLSPRKVYVVYVEVTKQNE